MRRMQLTGAVMVQRLLTSLVCALVILGTATAGPLEDAQAALSRGDRVAALDALRAHPQSDARAVQVLLGQAFPACKDDFDGYSEVVDLFLRDAARGDSRASFNLGHAYFFGRGVRKNHAEAVRWFLLAAEQGEGDALHALGYMHQNGKGVPPDNVRAYAWLTLFLSRHGKGESRTSAAAKLAEVSAIMTHEEIAEAQGLARAWAPAGQRMTGRLP